jgi:hypothetical protein
VTIPTALTGVSRKRLLQGMCLGALFTLATGFNWFGGYGLGWYTAGGAETQAKSRELAVAAATYPRLCADDFNASPDAAALRIRLAKAGTSYARSELLPSKWLKLEGQYVVDELADKCAALILPQKADDLVRPGSSMDPSGLHPAAHSP